MDMIVTMAKVWDIIVERIAKLWGISISEGNAYFGVHLEILCVPLFLCPEKAFEGCVTPVGTTSNWIHANIKREELVPPPGTELKLCDVIGSGVFRHISEDAVRHTRTMAELDELLFMVSTERNDTDGVV